MTDYTSGTLFKCHPQLDTLLYGSRHFRRIYYGEFFDFQLELFLTLSRKARRVLRRHFLLYQFCARSERDVETLRFSVEVERRPLHLCASLLFFFGFRLVVRQSWFCRPILPPALANARQKPSRRLFFCTVLQVSDCI